MLQPCMMSNLNPSIEPNHLRQARWETWSNFVPTVNKLSLIDWFCSDVNSITFKHTTSIHDATIWGKRKKKHPTFSLNFFHILTYPFLILFRPKRTLPFMRNVWLGIYHYDNHARCCIISSETFHLKARRLSQGQYFQIHYYFAQTVISTGNLHLAVAVRMPWE